MVLLLPMNIWAQVDSVLFEWQPNGKLLTKEGNSFKVVDYEGKSSEILYKELLSAASSLYNDPKSVISSVENKIVSISACQPLTWKVGGLLGTIGVNIHYVLKLHIKDNKVKVDAPYFTMLSFSTGATQENIEGWTKAQKFFNKDGSPSNKKGKRQFYLDINSTFNELVNSLLNYNVNVEEDW